MKEQLITFETAKLAFIKNFDEKCSHYYSIVDDSLKKFTIGDNESSDWYSFEKIHNRGLILAPTQSLLQKWLRDIHQINIFVIDCTISRDKHRYSYYIDTKDGDTDTDGSEALTYEEALEMALQEALKLL